MIETIVFMKALTHNRAISHDDRAHRGIWAGQPDTSACQVERMLHEVQIVIVHGISVASLFRG
jgi:hypothetical protein